MRAPILVCIVLLPILLFSAVGCDRDGNDLVITTETLPDATVGVAYIFDIQVEGDGDEFLIVSGDLPPGIRLSDNGRLSGVPTLAGTFLFTVEALDLFRGFIDERDTRGFALVVGE